MQAILKRTTCLCQIFQAIKHIVHHALVIFARCIMGAGGWHSIGIGQFRIEYHPVLGIWQIVTDGKNPDRMTKMLLEPTVMVFTPRSSRRSKPACGQFSRGWRRRDTVEIEAINETT
jgi:hypothetical protein